MSGQEMTVSLSGHKLPQTEDQPPTAEHHVTIFICTQCGVKPILTSSPNHYVCRSCRMAYLCHTCGKPHQCLSCASVECQQCFEQRSIPTEKEEEALRRELDSLATSCCSEEGPMPELLSSPIMSYQDDKEPSLPKLHGSSSSSSFSSTEEAEEEPDEDWMHHFSHSHPLLPTTTTSASFSLLSSPLRLDQNLTSDAEEDLSKADDSVTANQVVNRNYPNTFHAHHSTPTRTTIRSKRKRKQRARGSQVILRDAQRNTHRVWASNWRERSEDTIVHVNQKRGLSRSK